MLRHGVGTPHEPQYAPWHAGSRDTMVGADAVVGRHQDRANHANKVQGPQDRAFLAWTRVRIRLHFDHASLGSALVARVLL